MVYDHDNNQDGISRRDALEHMIWAGTGVLWTISSGVPKSLNLLGATEAAAGTPTCGMIYSRAAAAAWRRHARL